jgi:F0F1-type ATP synthase delta subunit
MGIKDLLKTPGALQEFSLIAQSIKPVMTDPKVSRKDKRKTLSDMCDSLSEPTFNNGQVIKMIMQIINMKEDVCKEYSDTIAQVNGILGWLPRMAIHRKELTKEVEKHRKQFKLNI